MLNRNYEITLLIRPDVSSDDVKNLFTSITEMAKPLGVKFFHSEYWGLRQLEYSIKKNTSAHFYYIQISSPQKFLDIFKSKIEINEIVIRHLIILLENDEVNMISPNSKDLKTDQDEGIVFDEKYKTVLNIFA